MELNFDYSKLRGRIKEKFGNEEAFAKALKITRCTLNKKLNNKSGFTQCEILKSIILLNLSNEEVMTHFFSDKCSQT